MPSLEAKLPLVTHVEGDVVFHRVVQQDDILPYLWQIMSWKKSLLNLQS